MVILVETKKSDAEISGILNILKPPGMTSFDVVGFLRKILRIKKIGHTGTLDPAASGVLPVCIGQATKAIEFMTDKDKLYRAELTLGSVTDTQDSTGEVLDKRDINASEEDVRNVIASFSGKYRQVPPMYSAVKINGKKLYELARSGVTVEREAREVEIYSTKVLDIKYNRQGRPEKILFDAHCSKGTYIRTLCADIGEKLGCGGHMSFLVRMKAGNFDISDALTLQETERLQREGRLEEKLLSAENVFLHLGEVILTAKEKGKFQNGVWIHLDKVFTGNNFIRVLDENREFIAVGQVFSNDGTLMLKSKKMFNR